MLTVKQGEVKEITFTIGGGFTVSELGTPTVIISQNRRTFALEIISASDNIVIARISKALSTLLVNDLDTYVQLSFNDGDSGVLVFPPEMVKIEMQYIEIVPDDTITVEEGEEILDVEIPEGDYDEATGEETDDFQEYVEPESEDEEEAYTDDEDYEELPSYEDVVETEDDGEIIEDGFDVEEEE